MSRRVGLLWVVAIMSADPLSYCAFCGLILAIPDDELTLPPPVFRDASGIPRRACWRCCSEGLRLLHEEGRIHGQLALVTAEDVRQTPRATIWSPKR